ncbi:ChaN family lipoprotein [Aliivibrio sp. S4TY2]|uniref:ChaN family lipoprotein n=1 Tax=unclassified Aliivibrio TaxID=2645654 RepID=UPI002378AB10|nr:MULTISPECIES: ChaN family lipoprotein [unclassified Aliivibrio]MDD9156342.1 ChaN family lipoprotein [Aliivibrio sp. S4TY2]MDD9160689.1 ChaN family lipoprotein [Aliivibrio sp. S4TY1]MDD9164050.1 ChaN family lipoprotein [Aliivibrio sp. S4MY2]MDD9167976.1 ChaN family lipoprotein [Aliivibrio sp. S4MY4]MDD9185246.1 ChaN family lipoprotein [Aliivibrio sp. S4MY3]
MKSTVLFSLTAALLLSGCSQQIQPKSAPSQEIASFYDYQLLSPAGSLLSLNNLPQEIVEADVILVGEWHTHAGIHRFQTDLFKQLSATNLKLALSMEQFSRDKQTVVNEYLTGGIGEQTLISDANAWPNYESDYRPLIEIAKKEERDVIAANAPKSIVKCIGQQGIRYLDKLDIDETSWLATNIDLADSPYKSKFLSSMHHGDEEQTQKQFAAQMTWDVTMAESIVNYLTSHPKAQVMHIAGKFHIENGLGTAAQITKLNPKLNVVVITPIEKVINEGSDYQLKVLAPPKRFVKQENMMKAYKTIKNRNNDLICK